MAKAKRMEADPDIKELGTCMVKTHLRLSDNPNLKGVPTVWKLMVSDILTYIRKGRFCCSGCRCYQAYARNRLGPCIQES
jgi:formyltetrahydrofolate synthetase